MKTFDSDLVLEKDTIFNESITVLGSILGRDGMRYDLKVQGNIIAHNIIAHYIDAYNIDAYDIDAHNIDADNIIAHDINAHNIDALDIICETRRKKTPNSKTFSRIFTQNSSKLERKYHEVEGKK